MLSCKHGPARDPLAPRGRVMVSVDPGGVHVGVAVFEGHHGTWRCVYACEMSPDEFSDWLANSFAMGRIDILVYERFILERERAGTQVGSEMETSQLIGVIRWLWRHCRDSNRWPGGPVELVGQTNKIKRPTLAVLKKRKIKSVGKHLGVKADHVVDAELHGYHHILKTLGEQIETPDWKALRAEA
jgi:hypothetical protein